MAKFRFQDLEIWQMAIEIGDQLFDVADALELEYLYRFAEQVRGAGMSMSNNIAEGSGCTSTREFCRFLDKARRSAFENVNIVIVIWKRKVIDENKRDASLESLEILSRRISSFKRTIASRQAMRSGFIRNSMPHAPDSILG